MATNGGMLTSIGEIVKSMPYIDPNVKCRDVDQMFSDNPDMRCIVIVNENKPIAQITRTHFYQKIGTLYGYNLYMGRECKLLAKTDCLIVDYKQPITEVSKLAMQRKEENLYDDVIVTKDERFLGVVSIRALLMRFVEDQVEFASFLNPLTQLPGNHLIDRKLKETLNLNKYSFIYFDLDRFKAYNDLYGFNRGDKVILLLTEILRSNISYKGYFLGHVGGDDFVAIIPHYDVKSICENIIKEFDEMIPEHYDSVHLTDSNLLIRGRGSQKERFTIMSLSIAVITNKIRSFSTVEELSDKIAIVKRNCKKVNESIYLIDQFELVHP